MITASPGAPNSKRDFTGSHKVDGWQFPGRFSCIAERGPLAPMPTPTPLALALVMTARVRGVTIVLALGGCRRVRGKD